VKKAKTYTVPAPGGLFVWKWQDCDTGATSEGAFQLYFDCVTDARGHGYTVELTEAAGDNAPGGAGFRLRDKNVGI
jgi:hypothetical protein